MKVWIKRSNILKNVMHMLEHGLMYFTAFILGFLTARVTNSSRKRDVFISSPNDAVLTQQKNAHLSLVPKKKIEIDEKRFVTELATKSLGSVNGSIGKKSLIDDDISSATSKLAKMKKNV